MSRHSTLIGGSTAERLMHCPGSWQLIQSLPAQPDTPSEYAEYGTAMHEAMVRILATFGPEDTLPPLDVLDRVADDLVGTFVYDRVITQAHLDESILPALACLERLTAHYDPDVEDPFMIAALEMEVKFPGIAGAYGTADLLLLNQSHAILVDWKFGTGRVQTVYSEEDGDRLNPQLLFYLAAAMDTEPNLFRNRELVVAIIQPRVENPLSHEEVGREEVVRFAEDVEAAVIRAMKRDPELCRGSWCMWCPAKYACPEWTGPIKELALLSKNPVPATGTVSVIATPYAEYLARAKELTEMLKEYAKDVDDQIHAYLTGGGKVPGWYLAPKKKLRQWIEPEKVETHLKQLGFSRSEIYREQLQTFAAADALARRKGVKIPDHLRVAPPSDETVVTRDPRAVTVTMPTLLQQLEGSVESLKKSRKG